MIDAIIFVAFLTALPFLVFTYGHNRRRAARDRQELAEATHTLSICVRDFQETVKSLNEKVEGLERKSQSPSPVVLALEATGDNPYEVASHASIKEIAARLAGTSWHIVVLSQPSKEDWVPDDDWAMACLHWPTSVESQDLWLRVAAASMPSYKPVPSFLEQGTTLFGRMRLRHRLSGLLSRTSSEG